MRVGDRVRYFTDEETGVLTDLWYEPDIGCWVAEVDHEYTCFAEDLVDAA